jgi:UDP-glucose 4-epimerase
MMKILLTGKSSFIGKSLYEYLSGFKNEYTIYAPLHSELDLTNEDKVGTVLKKEKFDIIIHAAMYNKNFDSYNMLSESLRIFYNLEKYSDFYGKMYYFGSGAEFDKTIDINSVVEEEFGKSIPKNYYGFAKYIMAKQADKSSNIYNLRLFAVYGKYEDWKTKFISNAIGRTIFDMPITISQNAVFDYMFIDDLCKIVRQFISITPRYHQYNICSGKKIELYSLAQKVLNTSGKKLDIVVAKNGLKPEYTASNNRMNREIKCYLTDIDTGINLLYDWYKQNIQLIDKSRL